MATMATRISDLALRISTQCKTLGVAQGVLTNLTTTERNSLVGAINELDAAIDSLAAASGAQIDDATVTSGTKTWSIDKIKLELQATKDAITNGAGAALDTLNELAAALGNDANFSATVMTALGKRVRFDAAQALTAGEKTQALANLGAQAASEIGNPDTNFVAIFEAGLV